ncbi:hypothetical protein LUX12_22105 [Streptomyces somaliensis]|uniref:YncE family protein n=1 Tax=Streptomyces somaliensis TaxID=78355 RepID=UPI0020CCD499|nr:hypothetical protein [Streptomyces somaliensis]MCP9946891.1 hypothetical protein [Streptomyces somaliensis]MCP9963531.1 hypothetical protein [Streptomyces somaliensis]
MRRTPRDQLAVVSQSGPTVTFFDAVTHEPLEVLQVPGEPHELCFDPRRRLLHCTVTYRSGYYHAHTGRARELVVIDPDAHRVVEVLDLSPDEAPHGVLTDPVRDLLWVSVEGGPGGAGRRGPGDPRDGPAGAGRRARPALVHPHPRRAARVHLEQGGALRDRRGPGHRS